MEIYSVRERVSVRAPWRTLHPTAFSSSSVNALRKRPLWSSQSARLIDGPFK